MGTVLFGTFKRVDKQIRPKLVSNSSYVDYTFGSDERSFAGCHRFEIVHHLPSKPGQREPVVEIRASSFICNPQENKPAILFKPLYWFHLTYQKLLFADGIRSLTTRGPFLKSTHGD